MRATVLICRRRPSLFRLHAAFGRALLCSLCLLVVVLPTHLQGPLSRLAAESENQADCEEAALSPGSCCQAVHLRGTSGNVQTRPAPGQRRPARMPQVRQLNATSPADGVQNRNGCGAPLRC
jgi:hypothetical protein